MYPAVGVVHVISTCFFVGELCCSPFHASSLKCTFTMTVIAACTDTMDANSVPVIKTCKYPMDEVTVSIIAT